MTAGYSSYDVRSGGYGDANGYGGRSVAYGDGFASARYDTGYAPSYAPRGLMDVAVAPVAMAASSGVAGVRTVTSSWAYHNRDVGIRRLPMPWDRTT